jgi:hypothetical protein
MSLQLAEKVDGAIFFPRDYFSTSGVRKLAMAMIDDAVTVIAGAQGNAPEDIQARMTQLAWLRDEFDAPISAAECFCVLGLEDWSSRFVELTLEDPQEMRRRVKAVMKNPEYFSDGFANLETFSAGRLAHDWVDAPVTGDAGDARRMTDRASA